jgi:hypothetical protein
MPGDAPIRLGSANAGIFTFEVGTGISTDEYGIQTLGTKALFPNAPNLFSNLPSDGASFSSVFGYSVYSPEFYVDYFDGTPGIEYLEGRVCRVNFKFKRIDPLFANRRRISVDSVLNYDSQFNQKSLSIVGLGGVVNVAPLDSARTDKFGFPEPVVSVKYSTTRSPGIGSGDLSTLYALPGSAKTAGFPDAADVFVPTTIPAPAGSTVAYFNGSAVIVELVHVDTTFVFSTRYKPHPKGWQLTELKFDPIANRNFFAVEETWRTYYFFFGVQFVSKTP